VNLAAWIPLSGSQVVIATMHRRARIIVTIASGVWAANAYACVGLDTDGFGTFARDIGRTGPQFEITCASIEAVWARATEAALAVTSERSFGPHQEVTFIPQAVEVVMFRDREGVFEPTAVDVTSDTTRAHRRATNLEDAMVVAKVTGLPQQLLV
jgi:hypothetical protein